MTRDNRADLWMGFRFKITWVTVLWIMMGISIGTGTAFAETEIENHPNGRIHLKIETDPHRRHHGWTREYDESGVLRAERQYDHGVRHGLSRLYYTTGELMTEWLYQEGHRHGPSLGYYKNGSVKDKGFYRNDQLEGTVKKFYPNGALKAEMQFEHDIQDGTTTTYYEDGQVEHVYHFEKGAMTYSESYSRDGQLLRKQHYPRSRRKR